MPRLARRCGGKDVISSSRNRIRPERTGSRPMMLSIMVVRPAPLRPTKATTSSGSTFIDPPRRTWAGPRCISDRNVKELALALRESSGRNRGLPRESELTQHLERLPQHIVVVGRQSRHLYRLALAREHRQGDIVENRKPVEQVDDLEAAGNPRLDPLSYRGEGNIAILEQDLAAVRLQACADQIDQGGLARSVRAHQRQEFALIHDEIEAIAGARFAELLPQIDGLEEDHGAAFRGLRRCPTRDIAPTLPAGKTSTRVTSTTPSKSCQYSVLATA